MNNFTQFRTHLSMSPLAWSSREEITTFKTTSIITAIGWVTNPEFGLQPAEFISCHPTRFDNFVIMTGAEFVEWALENWKNL